MGGQSIFGSIVWTLALFLFCTGAKGETPTLDGPNVKRYAPHGIQFKWSRTEILQGDKLPDGSCSLDATLRVRHTGPGCLLSVDLARDSEHCKVLVQRGEPLNAARCHIPEGHYPAEDEASFSSAEPTLYASLFSMVVLPTMYTWLGQSTRSPGRPAASIATHHAVRPPLRPAKSPHTLAAN
jgi:hypothetical protein